MEDYEEFCKKHLVMIQSKMVTNEVPPSACQESVSVLCFHGVAVLSPLMNTERKLEMQQYRQKAVELEVGRYKARKSALLTRVEEIIENVQVCKVPSTTECTKHPITQLPVNEFTTIQHSNRSSLSPTCTENSEDLILLSRPLLKLKEKISNGNSDERCSFSSQISKLPKSTGNIQANTSSVCVNPKNTDVLPPAKEYPDPYTMSLQNLLKKSREYIEREQNRRNGKTVSKEGTNESHSDKENDGVKVDDWQNERNNVSNRSQSSSPVIVDNSCSSRSSLQSQVASVINESFELHDKIALNVSTSVLCTPNLDFAAKSINGSSKESESDDDWINRSASEYENSLLKSLTGSYAKLPNPEPSRSPKIHQRYPRTTTNIVINNPVNAYELSPKDKFSGVPGTNTYQINIDSLDVRRAIPNELSVIINQEEIEKHAGKLQDLSSSLGKINDIMSKNNSPFTISELCGKPEVNLIGTIVDTEVQMPIRSLIHKDSCDLERASPLLTSKQDICQLLETPLELDLSDQKTSSLIEPTVLNKSYDVIHPSPVLLQAQRIKQQADFLLAPPEREKCSQSNMEIKAKRKLDLGILNTKENKQSTIKTTASFVQEMSRWIQERHQRVPIIRSENEVPLNSHIKTGDEDLITKQMLALVEMRRQLEEQHTLQLSMLIAEQEKEQEKLRMEIEEQERRLREQTSFVRVSSESCSSKETSLDWKRINRSYVVPSLTNRVDGSHSLLTSQSISPESSFSRWAVQDDGVQEVQSSGFISRLRTRRSQMNTPEIQQKFHKITALAKGFLTRRLMKTVKLKQLQQTVQDTMEFINSFQPEASLRRGATSSQDVSLQERVVAQLRAALYDIHDVFFVLTSNERMQILSQDREIRKEKQLRQMVTFSEKWKCPKERISLSVATQKSLDRKKQIKAAEMGITSKQKSQTKQKTSSETRILQPSQGQNAPVQRQLHRQGSMSRKSAENKVKRYDSLRKQHSFG